MYVVDSRRDRLFIFVLFLALRIYCGYAPEPELTRVLRFLDLVLLPFTVSLP